MDTDYTLQVPIRKSDVTFQIESVDSDLISSKWYLIHNGYAIRQVYNPDTQRTKKQLAHRIVLERMIGRPLVKGEFADHKNGDRLDNRRSNLRLATKSENARNCTIYKSNRSGLKGVRWLKNINKWAARIVVSGKQIHLGVFENKEDAYGAYCEAALNHFGEFARLK